MPLAFTFHVLQPNLMSEGSVLMPQGGAHILEINNSPLHTGDLSDWHLCLVNTQAFFKAELTLDFLCGSICDLAGRVHGFIPVCSCSTWDTLLH